jgi:hypothetical protein
LTFRVPSRRGPINRHGLFFRLRFVGKSRSAVRRFRAAQADVVNEAKGIYLGMETDLLDERFRYDGCHFNAAGRSAVVDAAVKLIKGKRLFE